MLSVKEILDFIYSQGQIDPNLGNELDQVEAAVGFHLSEKVEAGEINKEEADKLLARCLDACA